MSGLWLWLLPFLYLPNIGGGVNTSFGVIDVSDFVMIPYLALIMLAPRRGGQFSARELGKLGIVFVAWTLIGTLLMYFYYDTGQTAQRLLLSLLKVAKLVLYGFAGLRTAWLVDSSAGRNRVNWALLFAGVLTSMTMVYFALTVNVQSLNSIKQSAALDNSFKSMNQASVMLGMLLCYMSALWLSNQGTRVWRLTFVALGLLMLVGFSSSGGRGGMIAGVLGLLYFILGRGINAKTGLFLALMVVAPIVLYQYNDVFRLEVHRTFQTDQETLRKYQMGVMGVNEGGRLVIWQHEGERIVNAPIFGVGFFNRGRESGLWSVGSHNFWLQMFLETGLIGGTLVLAMFFRMWRDAGKAAARATGLSGPVRATLVAGFLSGMSGEYFYGGMGLFSLMVIYSIAGSIRKGEV